MNNEITDRRRIFLRLTEKERFETLWDMVSYANSERVKLDARIVGLENDCRYFRGELDGISRRKGDETVDLRNTSEKIRAVMADKWRFWIPILQYVVSGGVLAIVIKVLGLTFGGKP